MIKKLLSTFFFASAAIVSSYAQCTPNVSCVPAGKTYGTCPDSVTGLAKGTINVPYNETVSVMVPVNGADFSPQGAGATVKDIVIDGIDSLAPGLTYKCLTTNCTFPGGTNGCILISGTPTQVWNKRLLIKITANVVFSGFPAAYPLTTTQYRSIVSDPNGIEQLSQSKFDVDQNSPNPFSGKTEIHFNTVTSENISFTVYNMLGAAVYSSNFKADRGVNKIVLEANSFAPGVYVYSIGNSAKTITKRMVVSR